MLHVQENSLLYAMFPAIKEVLWLSSLQEHNNTW